MVEIPVEAPGHHPHLHLRAVLVHVQAVVRMVVHEQGGMPPACFRLQLRDHPGLGAGHVLLVGMHAAVVQGVIAEAQGGQVFQPLVHVRMGEVGHQVHRVHAVRGGEGVEVAGVNQGRHLRHQPGFQEAVPALLHGLRLHQLGEVPALGLVVLGQPQAVEPVQPAHEGLLEVEQHPVNVQEELQGFAGGIPVAARAVAVLVVVGVVHPAHPCPSKGGAALRPWW